MPKYGRSCIGSFAWLTKDKWSGQHFWVCCTFLPTSHHHPHVKTYKWLPSESLCLYALTTYLSLYCHLSSSFSNVRPLRSVQVSLCLWVCVCRCSHLNKCTEQSQSLTKLLEKKSVIITRWETRQFYLWICQRHYLNFFNRGHGEMLALIRDYMQPWNISGF